MTLKKLIILAVSFFLIIGVLIGILYIKKADEDKKRREALERQRREIQTKSYAFAVAWGNYEYQSYPTKYQGAVKPYLTETFYNSQFQKSMGFINSVRTIKEGKKSVSSTPVATNFINQTDTGYKVGLKVTTTFKDKDGQNKKDRTMLITWIRDGNNYKVSDTEYQY